jgi:dTDP-4-dehydrorhamnose 3,5-epimerase
MKILNTKIKDLKVIQQNKFTDNRGFLKITFHNKIINFNKFIFEYSVTSKKNVIRGLHFQYKFQQAKLIYVLKGKILDVVVDLRKNSPTFGKYYSIILSDKNCKALYVPEGFAHGFVALSETADVIYKTTDYWFPKYERCLIWSDADICIKWPINNPKLSDKDKRGIKLKDAVVYE